MASGNILRFWRILVFFIWVALSDSLGGAIFFVLYCAVLCVVVACWWRVVIDRY